MREQIAVTTVMLCLLTTLAIPRAFAASQHGARIVGEQADANDLMNFLGIHSWKVRVVGPLHSVSVEVIQYVRAASGQFVQNKVLGQSALGYQDGTKQVEIVAMVQETGNTDRFGLAVQGGGQAPTDFPKSVLAGYVRFGNGAGGDGLSVAGEHVLMAKYYNPRVTTSYKKDMSAYVALRIVARK